MPRQARIDAPGALHHIICRGIERRNIFRNSTDRNRFLERFGAVLQKSATPCYAWALIPNHFHLLLKTGKEPIASIMRRLLTGYAVTFNQRHRRCGRLFQNRYKSILCQEDAYLKELVRYIHLNPLRAGIVSELKHLNRYKYCGHAVLMGRRRCEWMDTKYILSYFGKTVSKARSLYCSYAKEGMELGSRPELVGGGLIRSLGGWEAVKKMRINGQERVRGDQRILGDSGFVLEVLQEAGEKFERHYAMKRLGYNLNMIEDRVCEIYKIEKEDIYSRSREKVKADVKALFCYWAVRELGYGQRELARRLGMTQPGVGYAVIRGEAISKLNCYQIQNIS